MGSHFLTRALPLASDRAQGLGTVSGSQALFLLLYSGIA